MNTLFATHRGDAYKNIEVITRGDTYENISLFGYFLKNRKKNIHSCNCTLIQLLITPSRDGYP